jgi:hypothetical protein
LLLAISPNNPITKKRLPVLIFIVFITSYF